MKDVTPLDLGSAEEKGEERALAIIPTPASSHNDSVSKAIEDDDAMKAIVEAAKAKRDKKREQARKALEEEAKLKEEAKER